MTRLFFSAAALLLISSCVRTEFQEADIEIISSQTSVDLSIKDSDLEESDFVGEFTAELRRNLLKKQKGLHVEEGAIPEGADWSISVDSMYIWGYENTEYCGSEAFELLDIDMSCQVTLKFVPTQETWTFTSMTSCNEGLNCKTKKDNKGGKGKKGSYYEGTKVDQCRGNTEMTQELSEQIKEVILHRQQQSQTY